MAAAHGVPVGVPGFERPLERGPPPLPAWMLPMLGYAPPEAGGAISNALVPVVQPSAGVGLPGLDSPFWQRCALY